MYPMKSLGDICQNLDNRRVPITKKDRVEGQIPYYGASGIVDYVNDFIFNEDLLLVSEDGANLLARTYPIAFSIGGKSWVNNHAHALKFNDLLTQRFIEYYLNSISLKDFVSGMAQPKLNQRALNSIPVPFPSISEQKRIVAILDQAFADIEQARAKTEQNLKNARELFESYLQQVFSQRGDGWSKKKLVEACVLQRGFDLPKRLRTSGEYALVSSSGIIDSHIEQKVKGPGVVTGRSGSIGRVYFIEDDFWPLNTTLYIKDFHGNDAEFICWLLRNFDLNRFTSGAGVPTLNRNFVHDELVSLPSDITEQKKIVENIKLLETEINKVEKLYKEKLISLEELKKSILHKAFSGELSKDKEGAAA